MNETGEAVVDARIPASLRERLDAVVEAYRGYEPSSTAAAVAVLCDALEREFDLEVGGSMAVTGPDPADAPERNRTADADAATRDDPDARSLLDEAFPYDWDQNPSVETYLPRVLDAYLETTPEAGEPAERVDSAVETVAEDGDVDADLLYESLVTGLYGGAGLSSDVATEFFVESLAEAESVAARETSREEPTAADGALAVPFGPTGDSGVATPERPRAECERCGTTTAVDDLETVIGPRDGSTVELLCVDCAGASE